MLKLKVPDLSHRDGCSNVRQLLLSKWQHPNLVAGADTCIELDRQRCRLADLARCLSVRRPLAAMTT